MSCVVPSVSLRPSRWASFLTGSSDQWNTAEVTGCNWAIEVSAIAQSNVVRQNFIWLSDANATMIFVHKVFQGVDFSTQSFPEMLQEAYSKMFGIDLTPEKLGIYGNNDRAQAHQYSTHCRTEHKTYIIQHSCGQRNRY